MLLLLLAGGGVQAPGAPGPTAGSGRVAYVPSTLKRLSSSEVALVRREIRSP